jgi:hypothetical protein
MAGNCIKGLVQINNPSLRLKACTCSPTTQIEVTMSRLNLEELDAVWVDEATDILTWFFYPGESKKDKKGTVTYDKKKEGKTTVPEQYLQICRSEESGKQSLAFFLNEEKVAVFQFTSKGVEFLPTPKWSQPKMYICIPTDRTFDDIVAETLSGVFKKWLQSQRFEQYLINQATDSTYTIEFVLLMLLLFAYLSNRDKVNEKGNVEIIKKGVDLDAVARSYLTLLTKLHNSSPRAKKLFPIRPLLAPAVEVTKELEEAEPKEEEKETELTIEVVPDESKKEPEENKEAGETTLEPLPNTSLPIDTTAVESTEDKPEEPSTQTKNNKKK